MASRHDSTNLGTGRGTGISSAPKKPITYGKSPRHRHPTDPSRAIQSNSARWQKQKSQGDATAREPSRPDSELEKSSHQVAPRAPRAASFGRSEAKQDVSPEHDISRKRKRSSALAPASTSAIQAQLSDPGDSADMSSSRIDPRRPTGRTSDTSTGTSVRATVKAGQDEPTLAISTQLPRARAPLMRSRDTEVAHLATERGLDGASSSKTRRPRLIDTLAAQRADSSDSDPDPDSEPKRDIGFYSPSPPHGVHTPLTQRQRSASVVGRDARSRPIHRLGDSTKGRKIKFTYSQARSMRNEPGNLEHIGPGDADLGSESLLSESLLPDPHGLSNPAADFTFTDDDVEDATPFKIGIKSVHELRRAGANHRFADEMEDLLSRIGSPTRGAPTMRRNALLELAQKLQREDFANQFRDHATRDRVAKGIAMEKDIISGFAMAAVLVIFLSSGTAPHLLRQLAEDGVGKFLARLLRAQDDIDGLAQQRKSNLPRTSRTALNNVKNSLLRMRIWHGYDPTTLSPRTLALHLLDIITRWSDVRHLEGVTRDMGDDLAVLADDYGSESTEADTDFALVVRVLEAQSSVSTALDSEAAAASRSSSTVARFLQRVVHRWPDARGELESTILRLAINTTNTAGTAEAFDDRRLLSGLASGICKGFELVQEAVDRRRLQSGIYDELLLILGVMINIVEHCPRARCSVDEASLERLVRLFLENKTAMSEADSEETSKLSVAFGYLSVLLGYLSLAAPVHMRMQAQAPGKGIHDLVGSIQEFVAMYRNVDSKVHELEGLVEELRRQQAGLQHR